MLALAVAVPGLALASHQFGDVPNANPFHGDISAIANAGVTSGCGGGNYCPDRNVTRAEMAAFMNRLGALSSNKTPVVNADKVDGFQGNDLALGTATIPSGMTVTGAGLFDSEITVDNGDYQFLIELPGHPPVALTDSKSQLRSACRRLRRRPDLHRHVHRPDCACRQGMHLPRSGYLRPRQCSARMPQIASERSASQHSTSSANGSAGDDMYMYYSWAYAAP